MSLSRGPHLARGCGVLDSAKSAPTSRSTLGLDSPRADVTHYSTRRCSRLCISRRYHVYWHTGELPGIHAQVFIHTQTRIHTHARLRHPLCSLGNSRHRRGDARTRAHCPHQIVLCNFSLDSSSLFLPFFLSLAPSSGSLASVAFLPVRVGFFYCHGQIRRCTALYTFMRFVMTSVITSFLETSCAPKVCVDINSKLLLDRCKKNSHFLSRVKLK